MSEIDLSAAIDKAALTLQSSQAYGNLFGGSPEALHDLAEYVIGSVPASLRAAHEGPIREQIARDIEAEKGDPEFDSGLSLAADVALAAP